jgi:hypothetical protein
MAAFIPYENQRGHKKFEWFVLTGVCHDDAEYSRRLQIGVEVTKFQRTVHSLQDASSAATKVHEDQVALRLK